VLGGGRTFRAKLRAPLTPFPTIMGWSALLLARRPDIGAILCGSDQVVRGVLDTARDLGRSAPDDIAVMGCGHPALIIATGIGPGPSIRAVGVAP
jgi:hypothetical protein